MNDYERENLVAWGREAAAYAALKDDDTGVLEWMAIDSFIEAEHTRYVVGERTGDMRLARKAGNSALMIYWQQVLVLFGVPPLAFAAGCVLLYPIGKSLGVSVGALCAWWVIPCIVLFFWLGHKMRYMRNGAFIRANLPDERTLNKSGYYEVEPNVWFNMITNSVLEGACYRPAEQAQRVAAARDEERAIRDLYRNRGQFSGASGSFRPTGLRSWYVDKITK